MSGRECGRRERDEIPNLPFNFIHMLNIICFIFPSNDANKCRKIALVIFPVNGLKCHEGSGRFGRGFEIVKFLKRGAEKDSIKSCRRSSIHKNLQKIAEGLFKVSYPWKSCTGSSIHRRPL